MIKLSCRLRIALAIALLLPTVALAAPKVSVLGLFSGKALLSIDGRQQLLAAGQASPEGVRLISADSRGAVLEIDGRRQTLELNRRVGGTYAEPGRQQLRVAPDRGGMYRTAGSINGRSVGFLVDTGASAAALSAHDAARLGVDYRKGTRILVNTAAGNVTGYQLTLDRVTVGAISLDLVKAIVLEGGSPSTPLLGMSFLGRLNMRSEGTVMVLETAY